MARESFEVYYHQNGRWQLHMSFEANQRELAIQEATQVEGKSGYPTRVIRETLNDDNTSEEAVSWQSAKAKTINDSDSMFGGDKAKPKPKLKRPPPPPRPAPAREARPEPEAAPKPARPAAKAAPRKPRKKKKSMLAGVFMAMLTSVGIALVISVVVALLVSQAPSFGFPAPRQPEQLLLGTFVLVFFFAFLTSLHRRFGLLAMLRGQPKTAPSVQDRVRTMTARPKPAQDVEFADVEIQDLRDRIAAEDASEEDEGGETEADDEDDGEPRDLDADMDTQVQGRAEPAMEEPPPAVPEKPAEKAIERAVEKHIERAVEKPPEKPIEKPVERAPQKSPAEVEARGGLSKFVGEAMSHVNAAQLNAFSRFGLNLYVAGAGSVIGQAKKLARDVQLAVVKDGLQHAGNTAERAEAFCVELPSYGKNPRYAGMIQAGVKAMQSRMGGSESAAQNITTLLNEWNLPEKRPTVPSVITFMFTDIVGSTEMTARLGNAGAQKAVRAHNTAVRGAISAKRGREVKHTGDGIMATFPDPAAAVTGAIQILRDIAAHNAANPSLQVQVRIGVNVGEAVEEENDFFGAAVQMTARICDKASKGNVWASQAVVDACKGQRLGFIPRGRFEMKGIQGAKILYEVGWTEAHKTEVADL
jgi:adenylate cyclase